MKMSSRWRQTLPHELAGWLVGVDVPWGIAGGWALDLWQGEVSREHSDIEIACFLDDLPSALRPLGDFEIAIARSKQLTPYLRGEPLPAPPFSLWLRRHGEARWDFEIVCEARSRGHWAYRRDTSIRLPSKDVFRLAGGLPIIAPKLQLLYKCKEPRPKDLDDLRCFIPRLDEADRSWLRAAVASAHPEFLSTFDEIAAVTSARD